MSIKNAYLLGAITTMCLLLFSVYLQLFDGFTPCPLCTLQRVTFALLAFLFIVGFFLVRKHWANIITSFFLSIFSLIGIGLAGRQVWLQHFPPANSECGVSLGYMMKVLPMNEVLQKVLEGSAECTQSGGWFFLSLDMADWSLVWFILLLFLSFSILIKSLKKFK